MEGSFSLKGSLKRSIRVTTISNSQKSIGNNLGPFSRWFRV